MKKLIAALSLLALVLLVAASALGQSVGASQIRKKTDGGIVADSANALAVGVYRGTSAPASPVTGQMWLDTNTTPATLKSFDGSTWAMPQDSGALVVASLSALPASPGDGRIAWITSLRRAVVYDEGAEAWYYLSGERSKAVGTYSLAVEGFSSSFLPNAGATSGSVAAGGSVTLGTHVCAVSYYNADGGETMAGTTTATLTASSGQQTLALSFAASVTGSAGKRVWCSKANTTDPLFLVATIDDTSTTAYNVTVADSAYLAATSPDEDFSAPVPSGWTVWRYLPEYGGCGSTGTTLLCATYAAMPTAAAGNGGVRLTYAVDSELLSYRVTARLVRIDAGFSGATSSWQYGQVLGLYSAGTNDLVAPNARGLGIYSATSAQLAPYGVAGTVPAKHTRAAGGAWTQASTAATGALEATVPGSVPHWAEQITYWDGSTWDARWGQAAEGKAYAIWTAEALAWKPAHVGIAIARSHNAGANTGAVVEIDRFTVEPW